MMGILERGLVGTIGGDSGSPKRVGYPEKRVGGGLAYKAPGGGP